MTSRMVDKFDKYWSEINGLLEIASILDPRKKLDLWTFTLRRFMKVRLLGRFKE